MITLTISQLAEVTGGRLYGPVNTDAHVSSLTTDSREVTPGALFVAKPGERTDGHEFAASAIGDGAVAVLGEREVTDAAGQPLPMVIVNNVVDAMGVLARHVVETVRDHGELTVIGITGSAGKTTTKDLLGAILSHKGPTVVPQGSYNGEVGLPLTVFEMTEDTRYLVAEMGATQRGNIAYLADIVKPDIGVVLMVGTAHVGEFGGIENIALTKRELVEAVGPEGAVVLNKDDSTVWNMREAAHAPVWAFTESDPATASLGAAGDSEDNIAGAVYGTNVHLDGSGHPVVALTFPDGSVRQVTSGLVGRHHVANVLAAATAASAAGIESGLIADTLSGLGAISRHRMERTDRADGVTVINDAYNANPESMMAALQLLAEIERGNPHSEPRRTWAVLGEMLELGEDSITEHDRLGRMAVRLNIFKTVVVGRGAKPIHSAAVQEGSWGEEAYWFETTEEAETFLNDNVQPGDVVLFKSSNGAGLRWLGEKFANAEQTREG